MKKILLLIVSSLMMLSISESKAQTPTPTYVLPMLGMKDQAVETLLEDISAFFGKKPNGMNFPLSKIVFQRGVDGNLSFEIEGVDNSWTNLFKYGHISYGYVIVKNRMFVVMGNQNESLDLNSLFYVRDESKAFDRTPKPATWMREYPKWFFSQEGENYIQVRSSDLQVLDK